MTVPAPLKWGGWVSKSELVQRKDSSLSSVDNYAQMFIQ